MGAGPLGQPPPYRQALTCVSNGYMGTRGCFEGCRVTPNQRPGSNPAPAVPRTDRRFVPHGF